jgi:uncharacterized OB-fold protein
VSVFETELKKGRFIVGQCVKCQKIVWPPSDFCSDCFGSVSWRDLRQPGILIEYSQKDEKKFCLVEFEKIIRIMGMFLGNIEPAIGQKILLAQCGFDKFPKFEFSAVSEVN